MGAERRGWLLRQRSVVALRVQLEQRPDDAFLGAAAAPPEPPALTPVWLAAGASSRTTAGAVTLGRDANADEPLPQPHPRSRHSSVIAGTWQRRWLSKQWRLETEASWVSSLRPSLGLLRRVALPRLLRLRLRLGLRRLRRLRGGLRRGLGRRADSPTRLGAACARGFWTPAARGHEFWAAL